MILATGGEEYRPQEYLYGENERVKTYLEIEEMLQEDNTDLINCENIVLINCVGSRNSEHPYCSKVCCNQSVQLALKVKEINPQANVFVLYRDMRTYGFTEDNYLKARKKGINFIRYDLDFKPEVSQTGDGLKVRVWDEILQKYLLIPADLVGLGVATVANSDNEKLAKLLKVPLNQDGFFLGSPYETQTG